MKVLYITSGFYGSYEANMVQSHNTIATLAAHPEVQSVTFIASGLRIFSDEELRQEMRATAGGFNEEKINFRQLPVVSNSWLRTLYRLHKLLSEIDYQEYDLIYSRSREALIYLYIRGARDCAYEAHTLLYTGTFHKRKLYEWAIRYGRTGVVAINKKLFSDFNLRFGVSPDRLAHVPCSARESGVVVDRTCSPNRPYITYCGSSYPGKGVDVVVEIARLFPAEQFLIVTRNGDSVKALIQDSPPNIEWKLDAVNTEVYELLAQSKIAIAPYSRNSLTSGGWSNTPYLSPLKVFEYMSCGCLVVASRLPAIEEVIQDDVTGLLFDPDSLDSLYAAMNRALSFYECDEVPKLVLNSLNAFAERYSYTARAESILALTS